MRGFIELSKLIQPTHISIEKSILSYKLAMFLLKLLDRIFI